MLCDDYGSWISCSDQSGWENPAAGLSLIRTGPYIGFSFLIDGGEHFGWAHISQEKIYG